MNTIGIVLIWCVVQVTLVSLLAGATYLALHRLRPGAASAVVLTGLLTVVVLSALAFSPWPRWFWRSAASEFTSATTPLPRSDSGDGSAIASQAPGASGKPSPDGAPLSVGPGVFGFWRTLLEEVSLPQRPRSGPIWRWPATVAAALLVSLGGGVLWLLVGLAAVGLYRGRSAPVRDNDLAELVDRMRAELGCRRSIELRQSSSLVAAATIGWRHPLILLPADWRTWTEAQRRAVLAHEIAHVVAGDFLTTLCAQFALLFHFYHPLVHWLMGRLRLEQELLADAAAAAVSGGQQAYLAALAELALRQEDRRLVWPARGFLPTRSTFLRRIVMLRDAKLQYGRLSPWVRVVGIGLVVVCGLLAAGLRRPMADQPAVPSKTPEATSPQATASAGADLSYVPNDAIGLLVVRPAAILESAAIKPLRESLPSGWLQRPEFRDLRSENIEQITVALTPADKDALSWDCQITIVRASRPYDFEKLYRQGMYDKKAEFLGHAYSVWEMPASQNTKGRVWRGALYRPDDRTMIAGSEEAIRKVIGGPSGQPPKFLDKQTWEQFRDDPFLIAADAASTYRLLTAPQFFGASSPVLAPLAPLWEQTEIDVLGVRFDDGLALHGMFRGKSPEAAQQVATTLDALRVLIGPAAGHLRLLAKAAEPAQQIQFAFGADAIDRLVGNFKVERADRIVRVRTSLDLARLPGLEQALAAARTAEQRTQSVNHLKMIALAMHNYHATYKRFPPAVLHGPNGTPYTWRVALLPFLELHSDLDKQYRRDEPWDSANNLQVLKKMPDVYRHPAAPPDSTNASYFVLTGPGTMFDGDQGTQLQEVRDGPMYTILAVEAKRDVPWTKPEDIPYDPKQPLPKLGGYWDEGFDVVLADGSVRSILYTIDERLLRSLITKAGEETVDLEQINKKTR